MAAIEKAPPAAMLEELKAYLRLEDGREDALLAGLLRAATEAVEAMLGQLLLEREAEELSVVKDGALTVRAEPAKGLVSALVAGEAAPLGPEQFRWAPTASGRGRALVSGLVDGTEVSVRYWAGLAVDWNGIPEVLRLAVIRIAAHFHSHRDAADGPGMPAGIERMLAPWKARRLQ